jgi:phage repressor protein C with HTH and peptisase S24 domain
MAPTLTPGKIILAMRSRKIRPGNVVVIWHEGLDKIKRVVDIRNGEVFVAGDNAAQSTDSRSFGWLPIKAVIAKVIWPKVHKDVDFG